MFSWFKKKQKKEVLKLLFQNKKFLDVHTSVYPQDIEAKDWLITVEKISDGFIKSGDVEDKLLKRLLEINKTIRLFYAQNDPEIKFYKNGFTTKKPQTFDQKYKPMLGWKAYYADYDL